MIDINELRKVIADCYWPTSPVAINEILDRLEAAEKAVAEALQQMVYSLKDRVEVVEKEYQHVLEVKEIYQRQLNETEDERAALRAKIAEMERQEPECEVVGQIRNVGYEVRTLKYDLPPGMKLYALPGAQPAPSINEGVRKVTLDFRWESEAQHHIPTIEIEFDPVSPGSPNDAKSWQDRDRLAAMLTPEAKP